MSWPIVTWRSCITSSSADCTFAGARLISSASRKLQNTGPSSVSKPPVSGRKIRVPTRSAGTRSGVNCSRLNEPPSTSATVLTVSVFASPGTPSSSTWPPARSATSTRSSIASWPTITRLISKSAVSSAWWASRDGLGSSCRSSAWSRRSSGVTCRSPGFVISRPRDSGRVPRSTVRVRRSPPRITVTFAFSPGLRASTAAETSSEAWIARSSIWVILSPGCSPACCAGPPGTTVFTRAPERSSLVRFSTPM